MGRRRRRAIGPEEEEEVNRGRSNWHPGRPVSLSLIRSPFSERSFSGKKFWCHKGGLTKEAPLSRPITRGLLNKVVKLMWDEIRMGEGVPCEVRLSLPFGIALRFLLRRSQKPLLLVVM